MIRTFAAPALYFGLLLSTSEAWAQPETRVIIEYEAPRECPSATQFRKAVLARLPEERSMELGAVGPALRGDLGLIVRVIVTTNDYQAELTTVTLDGHSTPRLLAGPDCGELMDAMAFTAALTVDPNASFETETRAGQPEAESHDSAAQPPHADESAATRDGDAQSRPRSAGPEAETAAITPWAPPHHAQWQSSVFLGMSLTSPVEPGVSPGVVLGTTFADAGGGSWSPAVSIGVFGSQLVTPMRELSGTFRTWGAQVEFCPSAYKSASLTARPCLTGQLMFLHAVGERVTNPTEVSVAIPNLDVHLELQRMLSTRWFLSGVFGAQLLLQPHRFDVGTPAQPIAETRLVAPFLQLRLGAVLGADH